MPKTDKPKRGSALAVVRVVTGCLIIAGVLLFAFREPIWDVAKRHIVNRVLPVPIEKLTECPACRGSGKVTYRAFHPLVLIGQKQAGENPCQFCDGSGRMRLLPRE